MNLNITNIFIRNQRAFLNPEKRIAMNQGGTSSSKTFSTMQLLAYIAENSKKKRLISIVSESMPHLKRGCIRDFQNIMGEDFDDSRFNKTDKIYHFDNVDMEFFPADNSAKLRGGRRDILYINECNNISYNSYNELQVRTKEFTILDYNPVSDFWAMEIKNDPEVEFIHSTYQDAKHVLPPSIVESIESRRAKDTNWWRVYGLGEVGNIEGLVHSTFTQTESLPDGGLEFYGLDFGFSNDPTALVKCVIKGDNLYSDQLIYEKGLTNDQIAKRLESFGVRKGYDEILADAAEPKSIEEIKAYGYNIKAAPKGPDSVLAGIQKLNQYNQYWTKRSVDGIKEQRNYRYIETNDGKITNKPIDDFNHLMDARRYALVGKLNIKSAEFDTIDWA